MTLKEQMISYTDSYGLIEPNPQPSESGNGLLYTSEFYVTLAKLNQLETEDKVKYISAVMSCEVKSGLFQRNPKDFTNDIESIDDYLGLAAGSKACNKLIAQRILNYGRTNKFYLRDILSDYFTTYNVNVNIFYKSLLFVVGWIKVPYLYNNLNPTQANCQAYLGRFIELITALKYAAGETPNWLEILYTAITIAISGSKNNTNTWILSDLLIYCTSSNWLCRLAAKIWSWRLKGTYGSMKIVYMAYFGLEYPLSRYIT